MKKVQDLIVGTSVKSMGTMRLSDATSTGHTTLTAGQIAVVDPDNELKAATASSKRIHVVQYYSAEQPLMFSEPLVVDQIRAITKKDYVAPAKQVSTVSVAGITAGEYYGVFVRETSEEDLDTQSRNYYQLKAKDGETATQLAARFAALASTDPARIADVTSSGTTVTFTGRDFGQTFHVSTDSKTSFATATPTKVAYGNGTTAQLKELESTVQGYRGLLNRVYLPDTPPSFVVAGTEYTTYVVEYTARHEQGYANQVKQTPQVLTIAIPAAARIAFDAAFITGTGLELTTGAVTTA